MAQSYSFPLLKADVISKGLAELNIAKITEDELRNPTSHSICPVFESLVEEIMGFAKDEMSQMEFKGMQTLDFPELHEDSIPIIAFFRAISMLMNACGITNFSIQDLTKPNAKNLRRQLSASINFIKFRDDQKRKFAQKKKEREELELLLQKEIENESLLKKGLEDKINKRDNEIPVIEKLNQENEILEKKVLSVNKEQAILRAQYQSKKEEYEELNKEIENNKILIQENYTLTQKLEEQIVNSPEKLQKEIENLEIKCEEANNYLNKIIKTERKKAVYNYSLHRLNKEFLKIIEFINNAINKTEECKSAKKKMKNEKNFYFMTKEDVEKIVSKKKLALKSLEMKTAAYEKQKKEKDLKIAASKETILDIETELKEIKTELEVIENKINEIKNAVTQTREEMENADSNDIKQLKILKSLIERIENAVHNYHTALLAKLTVELEC